jgi:hypothetical protein
MLHICLNRTIGTIVHKNIIVDRTQLITFPLPVGMKYINLLGIDNLFRDEDSKRIGFSLKNFVRIANLIASDVFKYYRDYKKLPIYDESDSSSDEEDEKTDVFKYLINYVNLFYHWFHIVNSYDFGRRAYRRAAIEIQNGLVNLYVPFDNPLKQLFDTLLLAIMLKIEPHGKTKTIHREIKRLTCCVRMFPSKLGEAANIDLIGRKDQLHTWQIANKLISENCVNPFELSMISHYMKLYRNEMLELSAMEDKESDHACYVRDYNTDFDLNIRVILNIEFNPISPFTVKEKGTYGNHEYSEYSGKRLILRAE